MHSGDIAAHQGGCDVQFTLSCRPTVKSEKRTPAKPQKASSDIIIDLTNSDAESMGAEEIPLPAREGVA